jgi:site-specific DNA recombinase
MPERNVRCAIYTRKSSEEGLEQSFNSLEAQREACRAFVHSQKHEGWSVLANRYDDGGFSGGTMERNAAEANTVRKIFRHYLRLGCVSKLKLFLERNHIRSKTRTSNTGRTAEGSAYSRGALYHLLNNRIYIGEIVHRKQSYLGQHQAIVPRVLWNKVASRLRKNNQTHRNGKSHSTPSLLSGKLFDSNGVRFTPTHSVKNGKRYCYYTSQGVVGKAYARPTITRFPARELERLVLLQMYRLLQEPGRCTVWMKDAARKDAAAKRAKDLAKEWPTLEISKQNEFVRNILKQVTVGETAVWIEIDRTKLLATLTGQSKLPRHSLRAHANLKLSSDFQVLRRGGELRVISPNGESSYEGERVPSLVKAVARARDWYERIVAGEVTTIRELERKSGLTRRYVRRILQCATLSPQITKALLKGGHRPNLTLKEILCKMPLAWREQEEKILPFL